MEQILEIVRQINELSGGLLDALEEAAGEGQGEGGEAPAPQGPPPGEGGEPVPPGQ